jgi:hypothetical protein
MLMALGVSVYVISRIRNRDGAGNIINGGVWIHELFFSPPLFSLNSSNSNQTSGLFESYLQLAHPK